MNLPPSTPLTNNAINQGKLQYLDAVYLLTDIQVEARELLEAFSNPPQDWMQGVEGFPVENSAGSSLFNVSSAATSSNLIDSQINPGHYTQLVNDFIRGFNANPLPADPPSSDPLDFESFPREHRTLMPVLRAIIGVAHSKVLFTHLNMLRTDDPNVRFKYNSICNDAFSIVNACLTKKMEKQLQVGKISLEYHKAFSRFQLNLFRFVL